VDLYPSAAILRVRKTSTPRFSFILFRTITSYPMTIGQIALLLTILISRRDKNVKPYFRYRFIYIYLKTEFNIILTPSPLYERENDSSHFYVRNCGPE